MQVNGGAFYEPDKASVTLTEIANIALFWYYKLQQFSCSPNQAADNLRKYS